MEKICEFCTAVRPVVYCKADAAHLCLSCDVKVHSANALSNRHFRTPLCDSCRYRTACVRCMDHRMFLCRGCDQSLHDMSSQHQKQVISSYMGCPTAKDFAALWGFKLNELENNSIQDLSVINVDTPARSYPLIGDSSMPSDLCCETFVSGIESEVGSGSQQQTKILYEGQQQQVTCFVLQQILDLKRLQLTEENNSLPVINGLKQTDISSSMHNNSKMPKENLDQHLLQSQVLGADLQQGVSPLQDLKMNSLPLPFSQIENLPSSSTAGIPLHGEAFWQCKSPVQSSQLWSQNMQDLGVCEDIVFHDDFNIPDVDLTFRNFEELFGADQYPTREILDDEYMSCSSVVKDLSFDKSDNGSARVVEGASVASPVYISQSAPTDIHIGPSNQIHNFMGRMDSPHLIRPSYSTLSFSLSRFSADNSGTDCLDIGVSAYNARDEVSWDSPAQEVSHMEARENAMMRYKEKKKARMHDKQIRYSPRKAKADALKGIKGRSLKTEGYDSDTIDVTQSY